MTEAIETYCELVEKRRLAPKYAYQKLFGSFFDSYCNCNGHYNLRVVTGAR